MTQFCDALDGKRLQRRRFNPGRAALRITLHSESDFQSRRFLGQIGIAGEIVHTPGHSDHCVSLLLDDGSVFTGDLPPEAYAFDNPIALATWKRLREQGATRVYPAHGPIRSIGEAPDQQLPE